MDSKINTGGIGLSGLLTVAFVVLRLCGVIAWPWLWVLSPIWISFGLGVLIILMVLAIAYWITR